MVIVDNRTFKLAYTSAPKAKSLMLSPISLGSSINPVGILTILVELPFNSIYLGKPNLSLIESRETVIESK